MVNNETCHFQDEDDVLKNNNNIEENLWRPIFLETRESTEDDDIKFNEEIEELPDPDEREPKFLHLETRDDQRQKRSLPFETD